MFIVNRKMIKDILVLTHRLGQKKIGVAFGPKNLKCLIELLTPEKLNIKTPKLPNNSLIEDLRLIHKANDEFQKEPRINIGGDHSLSIATIAQVLNHHPRLKVIWVDAHADINTISQSKTKNFHGMPLSFLTQLDKTPAYTFSKNKLLFTNILYIGLRDLDLAEKKTIKSNKIQCISIDTIRNDYKSAELAIKQFMGKNPVYLSFDVDSLDPSIMECTGTPVKDGLFEEETASLLKPILENPNLKGVDIVEFNAQDQEYEVVRDNMRVIYNIFKPLFVKNISN